ncbi:MAG: TraB domain-containing protein [Nanoarchaeota archaeon]
MKNFKNITLVGTSHVSDESVKLVKSAFKEVNPAIIAVELDKNRLYALKNKVKRPKNLELIKTFGIGGFLFYIIGEVVQKKVGKLVNIEPGSEMLTAFNLAKENNAMIALIDRDIVITMRRFSKNFKKRELFRLLVDSFKSSPEGVSFDIKKIPGDELVRTVVKHVKKRYPSLYKVLIDERDIHMASQLKRLSDLYPEKNILAVVGAGHIDGIIGYLNSNKENFI